MPLRFPPQSRTALMVPNFSAWRGRIRDPHRQPEANTLAVDALQRWSQRHRPHEGPGVVYGFDRVIETDLLRFLGQEESGDIEIADVVRIILAAADYSREITTTVMWLNKFENMDIRCIRLVPYAIDGEVYIDIQQVVPLHAGEHHPLELGAR